MDAWAEFKMDDAPAEAAPAATATPATAAPQPDDMGNDQFNVALRHLALAGATPAELYSFAEKHGRKLAAGVDENVASAKAGGPVSVVTVGEQPKPQTQADPWAEFKMDPAQPDQPPPDDTSVTGALGRGVRDVMNTAGEAANLVTLPITAPMNAMGANIRPYDELTNELADKIGLPRSVTGPEQFISAINKGAGMGALTAGAGGALAELPGVAGAVGDTLAAAPVKQVIGSGAAGGAADATRQAGGGPVAQTAAALAAGAIAPGASVTSVAPEAELTAQQAAYQAAKRIGLDKYITPTVVGGSKIRNLTAAVAQSPIGVGPINRGASNLTAAGEQLIADHAATFGDAVTDREALGSVASEAAQKYVAGAKGAGGRMYDVAAKKAGDATIDLPQARQVLDEQIARLNDVPGGGAGLKDAQDLRAALDRPYPVQGVRDMRTEMFVSPEFRNTPVEGRMKQVVGAASQDVVNGLRAQGLNDAAAAYTAADNNWRDMLANIQKNIEPIVGKMSNLKSGEQVATSLNSAIKNNGARAAAFVNALPTEQQGIVKASLLSPMGRDLNGNFSLSRFSDDWGKISPSAKSMFFGGEGRSALDDLATVGKQVKAAQRYVNFSNTGSVDAAIATGAAMSQGLVPFVTAVVGQGTLGRLLASPRFARWLARAPSTTLSSPAYIDRLSRIAAAEPAIAGDVRALQQHLQTSFGQTPMVAAAQDRKDRK